MAGDLVGVCCVVVGVGFVATDSLAVILAMRSLKLLYASSARVTLLIAYSMVTSTSSSQSDSDSYSSNIFSLYLLEEVTLGSSSSLFSSSVSPSSFSSPSKFSVSASVSFVSLCFIW